MARGGSGVSPFKELAALARGQLVQQQSKGKLAPEPEPARLAARPAKSKARPVKSEVAPAKAVPPKPVPTKPAQAKLVPARSAHPAKKKAPAVKLQGLDALKPLAGALKRQAEAETRLRREKALARQQAALKRQEETNLFQKELVGVVPLKNTNRAHTGAPLPLPVPKQRLADEQEALRASLSDEIDIERHLETDDALSFRQPGLGIEIVRKLRRGEWSVQAQLDLHGLRTEEARLALVGFLSESLTKDIRCLRVIHGKGLGSVNKEPVLKGKVLKWLIQRDEVLAFCQARPNDGGSGALLVLLRGGTR